MSSIAHRRARLADRRSEERGAGLVELSLVALLLVFLVASTFDYGFAWRSGLAVNESARAGARVGSGQAISRGADYYALNSVKSGLTSSGIIDNVDRIVIFKSTTADGRVPSACTAATPTSSCVGNVLTGAQLKALTVSSFDVTISSDPATAPTGTGCLKSASALRVGWCPNARSNNQDAGADYYGVYILLSYPRKFGAFGSTISVSRTAVMRLEPTGFGA